MLTIDRLEADVNSLKLRLVEAELRTSKEEQGRAGFFTAKRVLSKGHTTRFIGNERPFGEVIQFVDMLERTSNESKETIAALEELSVYGNLGHKQLMRLRPLVIKIAHVLKRLVR